jgi:zinc protease
VEAFSREQLLEFYNRYYCPSNAVLCVVGDVKSGAAMAEIEKVYGSWKNGSLDVNDSPAEPAQDAFRFKAMRGGIDHTYLGMGFHVPSILDEDYPALEMLSGLLGSGKSSRLSKQVVEKRLATSAGSDLLAEKWPGYFMVFASTPGASWVKGRDAVFGELARFRHEAVDEDELLKARRQLEIGMYSELETVEGQASNLGYYEVLGDYRLAEQHREAIRQVTAEQIMHVANKYFTIDNCSLVTYLPSDASISEPVADDVQGVLSKILDSRAPGAPKKSDAMLKSASPPKAREKGPVQDGDEVPQMKRLELDNGVRVLVKHRPTVPVVSMIAIAGGGKRLEPAGSSGLSVLATRSMLKGTKSFSNDDIVGIIEGLGGSIESFSSFDVSGVSVSILSEYLDGALPICREVLREPRFDSQIVEKEKSKLLEKLAKRHDNPIYYSIDRLFASVFGQHPYAYPFAGEESELARLTAKDCRAWHDSVLTSRNTTVVFVGDITEARALEVAKGLFGDLADAAAPVPDVTAPDVVATPGLQELRREHLKQAVGLVGFLAPPAMTDEAIALRVLNGIMTGLGGRLFVELRDKRSLGYMTGSSFVSFKDRSFFYGYANPGPEGVGEAIDVIVAELEKVGREFVTEEELNRSKEWLIGSQTMGLQRNGAQAIEYGTNEALGFGYDVVDRTPAMIQGVTKEAILQAAAGVFKKDCGVFVKLLPEMKEEPAAE